MTRPTELPAEHRTHLDDLLTSCPEMAALAELVHEFAQIMTNRHGNELDCWMKQVRESGLPELEPFLTGIDQDHDAAVAGLTLPYSSGPIEGVNTKTKLISDRCMAGPASSYPATESCWHSPLSVTIERGTEPLFLQFRSRRRSCRRRPTWTTSSTWPTASTGRPMPSSSKPDRPDLAAGRRRDALRK
ncbi:transposase [Nocardia otitidiscaviarum]|uniref:transposase n=1 Tax=Nocardia otitidiscaviarum TaxID=1823 RepID=UPI001E4B5F7D|nr:transposase [Nocardia otitidiscaviarum]